MNKVKYIIEVDKEDIDTFLTKFSERYITNYYEGENTICGRVLLSAFRTATPITESDENYVKVTDYYNEIGSIGYKNELIITKEAFVECYNKWIKGEEE